MALWSRSETMSPFFTSQIRLEPSSAANHQTSRTSGITSSPQVVRELRGLAPRSHGRWAGGGSGRVQAAGSWGPGSVPGIHSSLTGAGSLACSPGTVSSLPAASGALADALGHSPVPFGRGRTAEIEKTGPLHPHKKERVYLFPAR